MNEELRLINCCIQRIKSIEATLTDVTPATVANDMARSKCTWYINDCQQRIDDLNFTESPIVNYEALAEHEAQTFDEPTVVLPTDEQDIVNNMFDSGIHEQEVNKLDPHDGVPADTTKGGQL